MKVLITGGAGFIGSHLAEFHLKQGDDVCVVDNLSTGREKNIAPFQHYSTFHFEEDNLLTWKNLPQRTVWVDRIYHLAAMVGMIQLLANPVETLTTNILGCEHLLRVMHENQSQARLIVASTSEIYGPTDALQLKEDDMLLFKSAAHSKWAYATSKFTDEIFSLAYARAKEVKVTVVRLFNTIGPRQNGRYGMVVPRFVEQAVSNEPITVYGTGEQVRSFCDVRDTVAALDRIANNADLIGQIINLGQDQPITMNMLALMIKRLAKSHSIIKHINYQDAYHQEYDDIMYRRPDLTRFYKHTAYQFKWDLEKTLLDLIQRQHRSNVSS